MIMDMTFQITYTRPIPLYLPSPLGIRKMLDHVHSVANHPVSNTSCIIYMTNLHLKGSGFSSSYSVARKIFKCSACISKSPPGPVWMNEPRRPFDLLLVQDPVYHVNFIYQDGYGFPWRGYLLVEVCMVLCHRLEGDL